MSQRFMLIKNISIYLSVCGHQHQKRAAISLFPMNKRTSRAQAHGQEVLIEWCEGATFGPCAPAEGRCQPALPAAEGRMSNTLAGAQTQRCWVTSPSSRNMV